MLWSDDGGGKEKVRSSAFAEASSIVFPSLKKPNLEPTNCQNFRPISNLSFISKTLERLVSLQLIPYLENSDLLPTYQSGFRANHGLEVYPGSCSGLPPRSL